MIAQSEVQMAGMALPVYSLNTVVVGSGAAGLNCAARLFREMEEIGAEDPRCEVAVVTIGMGTGTSHNAGSDKQTYYKLGMQGEEGDTALDFARTLTAAGCCHGDVALVEGENSLRSFYRLADLGVPFPHNERGGFVGYKTDHDPRQRATSAGPWTSRFMVRKLAAELRRYGVQVFDGYYMLAVLTDESGARGLLCCEIARETESDHGLVLFNCRNVVVAGGGPGELYAISVYPKGQMGPYAALLEAGAIAQNLAELQFGIASLEPRWNLSGTYQQVIPRYYSTDADGGDVQEFLNPWFGSMGELATAVFLKGYQWPFDPQKLPGSSVIDLLVQQESVRRGRRVWMDFAHNPYATGGLQEFSFDALGDEARKYLENSGALQATPIERLDHMNRPSVKLYRQMGVDLWKEPIEIGVCCQHCNGGFGVDIWWETNVRRLFVIGELAGTHGVKRPGGSALNSGQVGALRAAQRIAHVHSQQPMPLTNFAKVSSPFVETALERIRWVQAAGPGTTSDKAKSAIQHRMSAYAGVVRSTEGVRKALLEAEREWKEALEAGLRPAGAGYLGALQVRELALTQRAFLHIVLALLERGSGSRGSHMVADPSGRLPHPDLGDEWRFLPENESLRDEILQVRYDAAADAFTVEALPVRGFPGGDYWFENTWAEFRQGRVYTKGGSERPRPHSAYSDEESYKGG